MGTNPDFSYTIGNEEIIGIMPQFDPEAIFYHHQDWLIKRTERETETRSDRFDRIAIESRYDIYGYQVHVWMKPREDSDVRHV